MDARLDPAKYAGLAEGDAHVIRNAGGRATDDAIRSLVISHGASASIHSCPTTCPYTATSTT
jgi:carbonic anhydrase